MLAYVNYANLLDQEGKKEAAEKLYLRAIQLEPENERAHYNLGLLYKELNHTQLAKQQFEKVLALDSTDADAKEELLKLKLLN